jgi:hypothetical protein
MHILDTAVQVLADDVAKISIAPSASELAEVNQTNSRTLSECLQPGNLILNQKKGKVLLQFTGKNSAKTMQRVASGDWPTHEQVTDRVKYLGATFSMDGSFKLERAARELAAKNLFGLYAKFFASAASDSFKNVVFRATASSVLLYSLGTVALSQSDLDFFEAAQVRLMRKLVAAKGFIWSPHLQKSIRLPPEEIRRMVGLPTVSSALAVRRLLWLRNLITYEREFHKPTQNIRGRILFQYSMDV